MAKGKRRRGRKRGAPKRTKARLTHMSIGCLVLVVLLFAFLMVPRLLRGDALAPLRQLF